MFTSKVLDSNAIGATSQTANCSIVISGVPGCPATKGFWHDPSRHGWPDANAKVDFVIYGGASGFMGAPSRGMIIGGRAYTQLQLFSLMPPAPAHGTNKTSTVSLPLALNRWVFVLMNGSR